MLMSIARRSLSLKATLLNWSAEVRAALGHRSSPFCGSDGVYSRELQTQPIRKLQRLLKSVRIGRLGVFSAQDRLPTEVHVPSSGRSNRGHQFRGRRRECVPILWKHFAQELARFSL